MTGYDMGACAGKELHGPALQFSNQCGNGVAAVSCVFVQPFLTGRVNTPSYVVSFNFEHHCPFRRTADADFRGNGIDGSAAIVNVDDFGLSPADDFLVIEFVQRQPFQIAGR